MVAVCSQLAIREAVCSLPEHTQGYLLWGQSEAPDLCVAVLHVPTSRVRLTYSPASAVLVGSRGLWLAPACPLAIKNSFVHLKRQE